MQDAPLFDEIARGPTGGRAFWLDTPDGMKIRLGHWPASGKRATRGTVLLFPGRTEYIEKYGPAARVFVDAGFDVISVDWRGQGLADRAHDDRLLGHVNDFEEFQTDVRAVLAAVEKLDLPKPYHLIGHSMGGCIGLRALHNNLPVNSAVFSGPMWGIGIATWMRPVAWGLSWLNHTIGQGLKQSPGTGHDSYVLVSGFADNQLTKDREMWDFMVEQLKAQPDLALGGPSVSWLYSALVECKRLQRQSCPATPTLTFLGTDERIVAKEPVRNIMGRWQNGQLFEVPAAEHEIMMEVPAIRDDFFAKTIAHFDAHS